MMEAPRADGRRRARDLCISLVVIGVFVAVVGGLLLLRVAYIAPYSIPSAAMEPTLLQGDIVLASLSAYRGKPARRGDLAVVRIASPQPVTYVKRIIGLPGDRIRLKEGVVYLNGQPIPREHVADVQETTEYGTTHVVGRFRERLEGRSWLTNDFGADGDFDTTEEVQVPAGAYFVLGDNRDNSTDSRMPVQIGGMGFVPAAGLVGRIDTVATSPKRGRTFFHPD